jgi:hypothetical protein
LAAGGWYLPASQGLMRHCITASREVGHAIPCPAFAPECAPGRIARWTPPGTRCLAQAAASRWEPHAGNLVVRGRHEDIVYAVSAETFFNTRDLVEAVFESLDFVTAS